MIKCDYVQSGAQTQIVFGTGEFPKFYNFNTYILIIVVAAYGDDVDQSGIQRLSTDQNTPYCYRKTNLYVLPYNVH